MCLDPAVVVAVVAVMAVKIEKGINTMCVE
jgi:hypothetical protein